MYLLDTNVVSELRRHKPHGAVLAWLKSVQATDLNLSAVTICEIQWGIEITRERDEAKAGEIATWLADIEQAYRILSMDAHAFRCWARMMHGRPGGGIEDAMIAATAEACGLTVVTRNERDFAALGVRTVNPFLTTQP